MLMGKVVRILVVTILLRRLVSARALIRSVRSILLTQPTLLTALGLFAVTETRAVRSCLSNPTRENATLVTVHFSHVKIRCTDARTTSTTIHIVLKGILVLAMEKKSVLSQQLLRSVLFLTYCRRCSRCSVPTYAIL